jgi:prepilin-type N-terminal cleavage/methylation domain-containing protein
VTDSRRSQDGFTLLELVIAMGILAAGLLAVAAAQLSALHMSARSRSLIDAMHLAEAQIESFQAMPVASLPATGADPDNPLDRDGQPLDPTAKDQTSFNRSWTIVPDDPETGITNITVTIDWLDPDVGVTRSTEIQSWKGAS